VGRDINANRVTLKYGTVTVLKCHGFAKCKHGGTCKEDFPNHSYTCTCLPNVVGKHCQTGE